jgi:hypothetical protein
MVRVVINNKQGLVQKAGGGVAITSKAELRNANIEGLSTSGSAAGKSGVTGGVQSLTHNNAILSGALGGFLMVDPGGGSRTGVLLEAGGDATRLSIANVGPTGENIDIAAAQFGNNAGVARLIPLIDGGGIWDCIYLPAAVGDGTGGLVSPSWWQMSGSLSR